MSNMQKIHLIDSHTGGEPTRMVYAGFPTLKGNSLSEKLQDFKTNYDHLRQAIILEPRGSEVMVGALLCEPDDEQADFGVIFFNNEGYLGMCGHGTIGVIKYLFYQEKIGIGEHFLQTPVGLVSALLCADGQVSINNVPSSYNVTAPDGTLLANHLPGVAAGTAFTQTAVSTIFADFGAGFVAIAIFLFAFTCLFAYYYIAETNLVYLTKKSNPTLKTVLKVVFLVICFFGGIQSAGMMWALGDIGFGAMCYLNFVAIVLLSKPAFKVLKDYDEQKKQGIAPVFDAKKVGVDGAKFWENYRP